MQLCYSATVLIWTSLNNPLVIPYCALLNSTRQPDSFNRCFVGHMHNPKLILSWLFSAIHKVGNIGIFLFLKFKNKWDSVYQHINFNAKHHDECKFTLKLIQLPTISNLFPLKVVQKRSCRAEQKPKFQWVFPQFHLINWTHWTN